MENASLHLGFVVAFLSAIGLVATKKWHGRFSFDHTAGIQKFHRTPTPRVGGVAIMAALASAWFVAEGEHAAILGSLLVAGLPAFCFGLAEDLTKRVSVRTRLLATMGSGFFAWFLTSASITATGIPLLDNALSVLAISVLFTAFAVGGVANAVNIIDGFNGLAGGTVAICLVALGMIAHQCGDVELARTAWTVCAITVGFLLVNFPFGKLFLGDGGAYLLGFLLAWIAVMLVARNPAVSPWAALLACAYPVFETLFTIARRMWKRAHPGMPDSSHLHSLVKVGVVLRFIPHVRPEFRNSSVSPFSWIIALLPAALSVKFAGQTGALLLSCLISFMVYLAFYWFVALVCRQDIAKRLPAQALASEELPAQRAS